MFKTNATIPVPENTGENWTSTATSAPAEKRIGNSYTTEIESFIKNLPDVVCLSHLRWGFVYQRPQHLLSRFAKYGRVFFVEEPIFEDSQALRLDVSTRGVYL